MSIVCLQNLNNMYVKMHCLLLYHFDWNFIYFFFALKMSKLSMHIDTNKLFKQKATEKDQSFLMWNRNRMNLGICNINNWPLQCPSFNLNISTFKCVSRKGRKITINSHELSQSIDSKWNQTFFFIDKLIHTCPTFRLHKSAITYPINLMHELL